MQQTIIFNYQNVQSALRKADLVAKRPNNSLLEGIEDIGIINRIDNVWESISSAIQHAYLFGLDTVQDTVQALAEKVEALIQSAKDKLKDIHTELKLRIQAFMQGLMSEACELIPQSILAGGSQFPLSKISYSQKVSLTGSLKTNILNALELTAGGELLFALEYSKVL